MTTRSLHAALLEGRFLITAEVTPPLSCDPADLLAKAAPMAGLADAVNVTDGASARAHLDALVAASILKGHGIDPVLQMTCRDRNRIALQSELVGAAAMGIRNVMMLTGDDPKSGDQPDAKPVFDLDSSALMRTAASIRDKGELPHGRAVGGQASFLIGCSDVPIDPKPGWVPEALQRKIAAGAQFVQHSSAWTWDCCAATSRASRSTASRWAGTCICWLASRRWHRQDRHGGFASNCLVRSFPTRSCSG